MKNFEKYKTAEGRVNAFSEWCADRQCNSCVFSRMCGGCDERTVGIDVMAHWLDLEAEEEKPLPCPFCGSQGVYLHKSVNNFWYAECNSCCAKSAQNVSKERAIANYNRVAKAVADAKKIV